MSAYDRKVEYPVGSLMSLAGIVVAQLAQGEEVLRSEVLALRDATRTLEDYYVQTQDNEVAAFIAAAQDLLRVAVAQGSNVVDDSATFAEYGVNTSQQEILDTLGIGGVERVTV